MLVLAGPGSGKTRVLTQRIAYLIGYQGVRPYQILAMTFTNKAAREMEQRVQQLLGEEMTRGLLLGTFHAICARLLRQEAASARLSPNYVILDEGEQLTAVKQALRDLNLDDKLYRPEAMRGAISKAKNELIPPADFETNTYWAEVARRVYRRYEEILAANSALDFDDLIMQTVRLFQEHPLGVEVLEPAFDHLIDDVRGLSFGKGRIAEACRDVQRIIDGHGARSPIIGQGHVGAAMAPARGLSIYFPLYLDRSAFYRELDFARATAWADFLEAFLGGGRTHEAP